MPNFVVVQPAPYMGLGLFAKHDIKAAELFLAERPLLIVPPMIPVTANSPEQLSLSEAEIRQTCTEWYEKRLEVS